MVLSIGKASCLEHSMNIHIFCIRRAVYNGRLCRQLSATTATQSRTRHGRGREGPREQAFTLFLFAPGCPSMHRKHVTEDSARDQHTHDYIGIGLRAPPLTRRGCRAALKGSCPGYARERAPARRPLMFREQQHPLLMSVCLRCLGVHSSSSRHHGCSQTEAPVLEV